MGALIEIKDVEMLIDLQQKKYLNIMKTHKATKTEWRIKLMNRLNLSFDIKDKKIVYKGDLNGKTLVNFLVDNAIEEDFK